MCNLHVMRAMPRELSLDMSLCARPSRLRALVVLGPGCSIIIQINM